MALSDAERNLLDALSEAANDHGALAALNARLPAAQALARPGASRRDGSWALRVAFERGFEQTSRFLMSLGANPWLGAAGRAGGQTALSGMPADSVAGKQALAQALRWISAEGRGPATAQESVSFCERAIQSGEPEFFPAARALHEEARLRLSQGQEPSRGALSLLAGPGNPTAQAAAKAALRADDPSMAALALDLEWDPAADAGLAALAQEAGLSLPAGARGDAVGAAALLGARRLLDFFEARGMSLARPARPKGAPAFEIERLSPWSRSTRAEPARVLSPIECALAPSDSPRLLGGFEAQSRRDDCAAFLAGWHLREGRSLADAGDAPALGGEPLAIRLYRAGSAPLLEKGVQLDAPFDDEPSWPASRSFLFLAQQPGQGSEKAMEICARHLAASPDKNALALAFFAMAQAASRDTAMLSPVGLRWDLWPIGLRRFTQGARIFHEAGLDLNHPLALAACFEAKSASGPLVEAWDFARSLGQRIESLPQALAAHRAARDASPLSLGGASRLGCLRQSLRESVFEPHASAAWASGPEKEGLEAVAAGNVLAALERLESWGLSLEDPVEARGLAMAACARPGPKGELLNWALQRAPSFAWKADEAQKNAIGRAAFPLAAFLTRGGSFSAAREERALKALLARCDDLFDPLSRGGESAFSIACHSAPPGRFELFARLSAKRLQEAKTPSGRGPLDWAFAALARGDRHAAAPMDAGARAAERVARALIGAGVSLSARDAQGMSPLARMSARLIEDRRMDTGRDLRVPLAYFKALAALAPDNGWSREPLAGLGGAVLAAAAKAGRLNAVFFFLSAGADAAPRNAQGKNALHYLAGSLARHSDWKSRENPSVRLEQLILLLIKAGADPSAVDKAGKSPDAALQDRARSLGAPLSPALVAAIEQASLQKAAQAGRPSAPAPSARARRL